MPSNSSKKTFPRRVKYAEVVAHARVICIAFFREVAKLRWVGRNLVVPSGKFTWTLKITNFLWFH